MKENRDLTNEKHEKEALIQNLKDIIKAKELSHEKSDQREQNLEAETEFLRKKAEKEMKQF